MHSSEKTENVLWSYNQESLEQALLTLLLLTAMIISVTLCCELS